jgi:hypothetical protein
MVMLYRVCMRLAAYVLSAYFFEYLRKMVSSRRWRGLCFVHTYNLVNQKYMTFTTRSWSGTTVLLCVLLLQNCQLHSVSVIDIDEEGEPAASSSPASAMHEHTPSKPMAVQPLTLPSASLAAHASSSRFSAALVSEEALSIAFSASSLGPVVRHALATVSNSLTAPYALPAVATPKASHAVPLDTPDHASSPDKLRGGVCKVERALREMPSDEEEDSKPSAQQQSTSLAPADDLVNEESRAGEKWEHEDIRRDALNILLAMAGSDPDKAAEFLDVLLVAAQDKSCRHQALEALGKVVQASPDMFSECLSSLRAAAKRADKGVRLLALKTLGEIEWKHYFGEVEPAPDLPTGVDDILDSACPFWPDRKVRDTHLLVLIPATVDGKPFTLNLLGELIQRPKNGGHETKYRYYNLAVRAQFGAASLAASYWLLMTRDVLPGSRSKTYVAQKALVADHARRTGLPYELPIALEAATVILTRHVRDGKRLYGDNPWTFTRCQERVLHESRCYPVFVGGFRSSGLGVDADSYNDDADGGVAGCRKF